MKFLARTIIFLLAVIAGSHVAARAFDTSVYASSSVLSSGRWVKVGVSTTGMHLLSVSDLRSMGFTDPDRVRIYGYGGRRLPDRLSASTYVDDLPLVQSVRTSRGVVFYAVGPETEITASSDGEIRYHALNPYSTKGYYFITDSDVPLRDIPIEGLAPRAEESVEVFTQTLRHERDIFSPVESGHLLLGEDFRFSRSQNFTFQLPGRVEDTDVWMQADLYGKVVSSRATFTFTANGEKLTSASGDYISPTEEYGDSVRICKVFPLKGSTLGLGIQASAPGSVNILALDNISLCYKRSLSLPASGSLEFSIASGSPVLSGASGWTNVWDVTDPSNIISVKTTSSGQRLSWTSEYHGRRRYAAWNENASLPAPAYEGRVANQDLHSLSTPELVIVTHPELETQSRRIAEMHSGSADSLRVLVVTPQKIYNEFNSGTPDVNAIRRMLKMYYDRGGETPGRGLKYVLMMGALTHDNRALTQAVSGGGTYLPSWQTDQALSDNSSFCSDDILTFLEDNSGSLTGNDVMSIAVGRIPARDALGARVFTDRLINYVESPVGGDWRSRVVLLADDEDGAEHLEQTEELETAMRSQLHGTNISYRKVYLDTYDKIGGVTEVGRTKLHNLLNDGTVWLNYIGHASVTALSGEGIMTLKDLGSLYLKRAPFFYGATCSFAQLDGNSLSGLEMLLLSDAGGFIGGISAVRPVYITRNGVLSEAMGRELFASDASGRMRTVADVMRRAKNRVNDTNKLRYITLCDPAMRLAVPENIVGLTSIDDTPTGDIDGDPVTVPSLSKKVFKGVVTGADGKVIEDFDGTLSLTLYDAEQSFTTLGRGKNGKVKVYDEQGERIFAGSASIKGGHWEASVMLPQDIADNYRPATLMMYGEGSDGSKLAAGGADRSFYVYGVADDAVTDDVPPVIESLFLNHESFEPGGTVNTSPMLIARVRDDNGFNLSTSSIGHEMNIRIDDDINLTDVSSGFTPDSDGSPAGDIVYQLPELTPGNHTARLKVWDIGGNSTTASVEFFVDPSAAPKIFDMYSDANPATTEANFYIIHNRPESMLSVTVEIYDLGGSRLWSSTTTGRADMYASKPVTWDLTNSTGQRVGRGIYLYRTTVTSTDNGESSVMTKRIAVAGM